MLACVSTLNIPPLLVYIYPVYSYTVGIQLRCMYIHRWGTFARNIQVCIKQVCIIQCKHTLHAGAVLLVYIYLGCISQPNRAWGCIFSGCSGPFSSQSRLVLCAIPIYATPSVSQPHILQFETNIFGNLRQIYLAILRLI